jgi:GntP family gluconate:H+ symporter
VFFDTVFYLLVPLVRSMYRRTRKHYVLYLMAVATAATAHALIPPTPGPLVIAQTLGVDIGLMILFGCLVGIPAAITGLWFARLSDRRMPDVTPPDDAIAEAAADRADQALPGLALSLAPIVLPVGLITLNTAIGARADLAALAVDTGFTAVLARSVLVLGNPNLALLISAAIALATLAWQRREDMGQIATAVEHALMSGGMIVLITAAGGAFGGMLRNAGVGDAIKELAQSYNLNLLVLAWLTAILLRVAQGSATVSMITTSAIIWPMIDPTANVLLPFHTMYVFLAIGFGAFGGSWMNDSGFWVVSKLGGLTEKETVKSWSLMVTLVSGVGLIFTLALSRLLPLAPI